MIGRALYPLRLRQRLLLVEGVLFAVVLAGVLSTTIWYANGLRGRIDRERLNATVALAGEVDRLLAEGITALQLLASAPPLEAEGAPWPGNWMSTTFTGGLLWVSGDGRVARTDPLAVAFAGADMRPHLDAAARGPAGTLAWGMERPEMPPVMAVAVPRPSTGVAGGGGPRRYVVGLIDLDESSVAKALRSAKLIGETGHADLVDARGVSMLSTERDHALRVADHGEFYVDMFGRAEHRADVAQVAYVEGGVDLQRDHVMGFEFLTSLPWAVTLGGDAAQTYAPIRALWYSVGALTTAFVAVAVVITWLGSNQLVRPIQSLTASARRVAGGELDTPLTTEVGGEIEVLGESIDSMRQSRAAWGRERDRRVQARTEELQQRTTELAASEAVARDATSTLALEQLLESVAATLESRLPIDGVVLYTPGAGARPDILVASPGVPARVAEESRRCFTCAFAQGAGPTLAPWRSLPVDSVCDLAGYRSAAVLPLRAGDQQVGTMCLLRRDAELPSPTSMSAAFLSVLAAEVGMGTGNALLFEDLRLREEHRRELVVKVLSAQEEERRRLARELHDGTGQALTALLLGLDAIELALSGANAGDAAAAVQSRLALVRGLAGGALAELRTMVLALRPSDLDDMGLVPAISRYVSMSAGNSGIDVSFETNLDDERLPPDLEIALFRIVQEALNNVVRHSRASKAAVRIQRSGADVVAEVWDNGVGFAQPNSHDPLAGVGIAGMHERAALVGGVLAIASRPGEGTSVRLTVQPGLSIGGLDAAEQAPRRTR